jgi:hypothetical protein
MICDAVALLLIKIYDRGDQCDQMGRNFNVGEKNSAQMLFVCKKCFNPELGPLQVLFTAELK